MELRLNCLLFTLCIAGFSAVASSQNTHKSGYTNKKPFQGPTTVEGELEQEDKITTPLFTLPALDDSLSPWFSYKESLNDQHGLRFGFFYNALYQSVSHTLEPQNEYQDTAALGIIRFNAAWDVVTDGTDNLGTLYMNLDNRHRLGTDIAPADIASQIGYIGMTGTLFSDVDTVLVDLNYQHRVNNKQGGVIVGRFDPNDYVFVSGYANPWTTFQNVAVLLNPSVALPDASWGVGAGHWLNDSFYALGTVNDANGTVTDNLEFFSGGSELWKAIEFGWSPDKTQRFSKQINVSAWHVDQRDGVTLEDSYGIAVSANWLFANNVMGLFRAGWSQGDSPIYNQTATLGLTYKLASRSDELGVAINWGKPAAPNMGNQLTSEVFYRLQVAQNLAVTPSLQFLNSPSLNEEQDVVLFGLRFRFSI